MIEDLKQVRDALASIAYRPLGGKTEDYLCSVRIQTDAREALAALDRIIADHIPDASKMVVPDGYKLVPIEPTGPMIMSGIHAHERNDDLPNIGTGPKSVGIYKAMLSAAPTPADKKPSSTLIARHTINGEELVCVAPWYWDEMNKTMSEFAKEPTAQPEKLGNRNSLGKLIKAHNQEIELLEYKARNALPELIRVIELAEEALSQVNDKSLCVPAIVQEALAEIRKLKG